MLLNVYYTIYIISQVTVQTINHYSNMASIIDILECFHCIISNDLLYYHYQSSESTHSNYYHLKEISRRQEDCY